MPARLPTRSARPSSSSHLSQKSSVTNLNSRASTNSRLSSPNIPKAYEGPSSSLRIEICSIFADSQKNTAGHRKLIVRLRKFQENCCYEPVRTNGRQGRDTEKLGEEDFNAEVGRCVLRILGVKKTEGAGDRVIRFLGLFLKSASEKDMAIFAQSGETDETQALPETPTSRLTFTVLSTLLPVLTAKEKTVRFRATQIVSHVVNSLDSIDDELYHLIRQGLIKRIRDKEPTIRIQAVIGLGRLAGNEAEDDPDNEDSDNDDAGGLLERLLEVLQNDSSAEVRRSLLLNLPLTPATLPYLLERARDLDAPTRRALYSRLLPTLGDFRHLSLSMREKLLRWGLRDRDENVRKATARLFRERWIEDCAGSRMEGGEPPPAGHAGPPSISGLTELLERVDVVNSGVENGIALEAMREFWAGRPDYRDAVTFDNFFWDNLSAETVFMARTFNEFCREGSTTMYDGLIEEKMPEVTKLAFYLQKYTNSLLETIAKAAEAERDISEEDTVEQEFIVEQLLHIAQTLDYSDEVGRRKMFSLLRESLAVADLPDEITRLTVEALRGVCGIDAAGEREFCGVVLEAIAEVHDNILPQEESFVSARSEVSDGGTPTKDKPRSDRAGSVASSEGNTQSEEKVIKEIMINMKCLHIAQCMLQNVEGNLQRNMHLVTMLNNLVVPAVRSHEAPIRERGLHCLGLCCLLDKTLAEENAILFIHCFTKGHEVLQVTALQILSDILTTHPSLLPGSSAQDDSEAGTRTAPAYQKPLYKAFNKALKHTSPPQVQAAGATTLSKLLLTGILNDPELLKALVLAFFDPRTRDNAGLRQSLAYFLPVYCHSRRENMVRMADVAVSVVHGVMSAADEFYSLEMEEDSDGDVDESVSEKHVKALVTTVVGMLVEWTDARKLVNLQMQTEPQADDGQDSGHMKVAGDLLERVLGTGCPSGEKKILLSMLGKLYIAPPSTSPENGNPEPDLEPAQRTKELLDEAIVEGVATDAAGRNALVKVKNAVLKVLAVGKKKSGKSTTLGSDREEESEERTMMGRDEDARTEVGDVDVQTEAGDVEPTIAGVEADDMEEDELSMM